MLVVSVTIPLYPTQARISRHKLRFSRQPPPRSSSRLRPSVAPAGSAVAPAHSAFVLGPTVLLLESASADGYTSLPQGDVPLLARHAVGAGPHFRPEDAHVTLVAYLA